MGLGATILDSGLDTMFSPGQLHFDPKTNTITDSSGQPYHPSVIARMFSPSARQAWAQQTWEPALAEQQAAENNKIQRQTLGTQVDTMEPATNPYYHSFVTPTDGSQNLPDPSSIKTKQRDAWISSLQNEHLAPTYNSQQIKSQAGIPLIGQTGAFEAQTGLNNSKVAAGTSANTVEQVPQLNALSNKNLANELNSANTVTPLQLQLAHQQIAAQLKREGLVEGTAQYEAAYRDAIAKANFNNAEHTVATIGNQAKGAEAQSGTDAYLAQRAADDQQLTGDTLHNERVLGNVQSSYVPDPVSAVPYLAHVGQNGVDLSGGHLSPYFKPAAAATLGAIKDGAYNGGASPLPSGGTFTPAPAPQTLHTTVGQQGTPTPSTPISTQGVDNTDNSKIIQPVGAISNDGGRQYLYNSRGGRMNLNLNQMRSELKASIKDEEEHLQHLQKRGIGGGAYNTAKLKLTDLYNQLDAIK